jgi:hypothetical protein
MDVSKNLSTQFKGMELQLDPDSATTLFRHPTLGEFRSCHRAAATWLDLG